MVPVGNAQLNYIRFINAADTVAFFIRSCYN